MSTKTLAQFTAGARSLASEMSQARFSDTEIEAFVNDAVSKVFNMLKGVCTEAVAYINTVAGTREYTEPTRLFRPMKVHYDTTQDQTYRDRLIPLSDDQMDIPVSGNPLSQGVPDYYYVFNGKMGFHQIPAITGSNIVRVRYRIRPVTLSGGDTTNEMNEACDHVVTLFAARMIHLANQNHQEADTILSEIGVEMSVLSDLFKEETDDSYETCDMEFPDE